jgi:hypothetical protein
MGWIGTMFDRSWSMFASFVRSCMVVLCKDKYYYSFSPAGLLGIVFNPAVFFNYFPQLYDVSAI